MKQKKNKTKQTHRRRNVEFMDWSWKLGVLRYSRDLGFLCDSIWHYSPNVLKNIFINVMEICVVKSLFLICLWTPIES